MFRFTILAVGKIKSRPLASLCDDFVKRLRRQGQVEWIEIKDSDVETEGARILEFLDKRSGSRSYALAEEGRGASSVDFAGELDELRGQHAIFIIGGAYGLSESVKARADRIFSLSPLTFTHEIARMLLCEQLYRAVSIHSGSKYHHE